MSCPRCGSDLVFIEDCPSCPDCERIGLVPPRDSLAIMESILGERKRGIMDAIVEYDRNHVLLTAFTLRESLARRFTLSSAGLDIAGIVACTAMIREVLGCRRAFGGRRGDAGPVAEMIRDYGAVLGARDYLPYLRAGTYSMIRMARYDLSDPGRLRLRDFPLYPNEKHRPVSGAFAKHGILTGRAAAQKAGEARGGAKPAGLGSKRIASVASSMPALYPVCSILYAAFGTNRERQAHFALPDGAGTGIMPLDLKRLVAAVPAFDDQVACCDAPRLERLAKTRFAARSGGFARNFVASRGNPGAFPLFLEMAGRVFVSHFFGELYCYALMPVLHKREFDRETERRSLRYERTVVPAYYEQAGFAYTPNVRVKGLHEIDGIAVLRDRAYVIEAKCWSPKALLGGPDYVQNLTLKVKGAVEGLQYERGTGQAKRRGVPLPRKVEWVRQNRERLGIGDGTAVEGVLVTNTAPPMAEHMGCRIVFVDDSGM